MSRSKLNPAQIAQFTYDEVAEAQKVKIQDTSFAIELDHTDGDSVTTHPAKLTVSVLSVSSPADDGTEIIPALDCSSLSQVRVDINGTGTVQILASPTDSGSYFYSVGGAGTIHNICARRLKVISTNANGDVHLVGRS
jgi:hypothetical protein